MAKEKPRTQCAALPYRVVNGDTQVMLVTSRETGRWIVPKGWPVKKLKSYDQAAREAFEEAGVVGDVSKKPFGSYGYDKRLGKRVVHCLVEVFLLKVTQELEAWPERAQRSRRWVSPLEAVELVDDKGLAALLMRLNAPM